MTFAGWVSNSCAANSIVNLGDHTDPINAMISFCSLQLGTNNGFVKSYQPLFSYYIFIAGPEVPLGEKGGGYHSKPWVKYGTEFAEFIKTNNLGEIATLPPRLNVKFHPTTTAQVWLWAPNQKNLEVWWADQQSFNPTLTKNPKVKL